MKPTEKVNVIVYTCPNCRREMKNDKLGSLNDYLVVCESCGWRGWTNNVITTSQIVEKTVEPGERLVTLYDTSDATTKGVKRGKKDDE